ncbi:MAG: hypothetical protein Q8M31_21870 [Beijerinckiaceae bacterium]|nr:hypothetical protein [Beijerinckiaceae bacterium]
MPAREIISRLLRRHVRPQRLVLEHRIEAPVFPGHNAEDSAWASITLVNARAHGALLSGSIRDLQSVVRLAVARPGALSTRRAIPWILPQHKFARVDGCAAGPAPSTGTNEMNISTQISRPALKVRTVGAKPTEGFWKFGHAGDFLWIGPSHDEQPVALVPFHQDDARDPAEARANAAMMAASIDLLHAARIAANACDILADECRDDGLAHMESIWRRKAAIARAAIDKAESA